MSTARRGYHHGNLAAALVNAAGSLVESDGAENVTLRGAAIAAGVSPAAPYRHFADKDALLAAVAARGFDELADTVNAAWGSTSEEVTGFKRAGLGWVRFAANHPSVYQLMFSPGADKQAHPTLLTAAQKAPMVVLRAVESCQQAKAITAAESAASVAQTACAIFHGLASMHADGLLGKAAAEQAAAKALEHLLQGILTKPQEG